MTGRRTSPLRHCDAPGCDVPVRRGVLMCRPHWFAMPKLLREAIGTAWRDHRFRDRSAACLTARTWHRDHPDAVTVPPPPARRFAGIDLSHPEHDRS